MSKGVYIHIPFCVRKCLYCDFCSTGDHSLMKEYVNALINEIKEHKGTFADTVFIGGGTPTVLGDELIRVINAVKEAFRLEPSCEFTVEANPGTVDYNLLSKMKEAGVNRLSLGVQSFNDNELKALGRIHSAVEAKEAFLMARKAGFDNINIDIMLSTPHQTLESVKSTLEAVKEMNPEHVSAYSLIIEEGTPFYDMELDLPDEDTEREIYYYTVEYLKSMGLERYEISNFAKTGYEARHNIKYWTQEEYIGLGVAAASFENNCRYTNTCDIASYINGKRYDEREFIDKDEQLKEKFMLGLRMSRGVKYSGEFEETIEKLIAKGLLEKKDGFVHLTEKGFDLGNVVFMEFV
ncbi:MAG: radical SAM family heme chaperone HemW [Clostridia bacterium]|nr:radical SAM family heme chaperone HemW [Clostridia bacterium]